MLVRVIEIGILEGIKTKKMCKYDYRISSNKEFPVIITSTSLSQ